MIPLIGLLFLFPVVAFVPGFLIARRWRLPTDLRLGVSIAVSLLAVGAAAFGLYLSHAVGFAYAALVAAIVVAAAASRRATFAFLRAPSTRGLLGHYAIFLVWLLFLCVTARNFSGDGWSGDWEEHYQRARLFGGRGPLDAPLVGGWSVAARPPLQNLVTAFFLRTIDDGFSTYQLATVLLSSLIFFGAAALASVFDGGRAAKRQRLLALTVLLGLNPSVIQNATYSWTRSLTGFFVLLGIVLFWRAAYDGVGSWRRWAWFLLGLAAVTHYSAGPYVVALLLLEGAFVATRRLSVRAAVADLLLLVAPLAPWLGFAAQRFGVAETFLSNSTAMDTAVRGVYENVAKILGNVVSTWIPYPLLGVPPLYGQADRLDRFRDAAFLLYQQNLPFMVGSIGGVVVLVLAVMLAMRERRAGALAAPVAISAFVLVAFLFGIATVGQPERFGAGHICLQPLAVAGVAFLASRWPRLPRRVRVALGIGLLVDGIFGIALHFWMRHLTLHEAAARAVSPNFLDNLRRQTSMGYVLLGDLPSHATLAAVLLIALVTLVWRVVPQKPVLR
jgi:4-amino-4-deoxy-L-arabinose transferase-like glycosyltransferase